MRCQAWACLCSAYEQLAGAIGACLSFIICRCKIIYRCMSSQIDTHVQLSHCETPIICLMVRKHRGLDAASACTVFLAFCNFGQDGAPKLHACGTMLLYTVMKRRQVTRQSMWWFCQAVDAVQSLAYSWSPSRLMH